MELIRLTGTEDKRYERAMRLYRASFPPHEQRSAAAQAMALRDEDYHFGLVYDGGAFAGLLLYWEAPAQKGGPACTAEQGFVYVEHFCILPELRGMGCGRRALELLQVMGKRIVLEIDPPEDAIAVRRKGFYERCGFAVNPYPHIHPPYHRGNGGHALVVMSWPGALPPKEYSAFAQYLQSRVMDGALL